MFLPSLAKTTCLSAGSLVTILVTCVIAGAAPAEDSFKTRNVGGQYFDVMAPGGDLVFRYVYLRDKSAKDKNFDSAKVFAHVVVDEGRTFLTKGPGGLFPHHRGIFIGWNRLQHGDKRHDLWHVRTTEQIHKEFLETSADEDSAIVKSRIAWNGVDGEPVIDEVRTHRVLASDDALTTIDFESKLTAVGADVELNGDPEHAGCQFRPSQKVAENKSAKYIFHEDGIDPKKDKDLPWVAETFTIDEQEWTVQHMSHPGNPKGARWSAYRDYGRFGPFTVVKIPEGESQTFRYRFRITKGPAPSREALAAAYKQYAGE